MMRSEEGSVVAAGPARISAEQIAGYCGAVGDVNPIHVDLQAAADAGFDACIVPGGMLTFFLEQVIVSLHPTARIDKIRTRFAAPLTAGTDVRFECREIRKARLNTQSDMAAYRLTCLDVAGKVICIGDVTLSFSEGEDGA